MPRRRVLNFFSIRCIRTDATRSCSSEGVKRRASKGEARGRRSRIWGITRAGEREHDTDTICSRASRHAAASLSEGLDVLGTSGPLGCPDSGLQHRRAPAGRPVWTENSRNEGSDARNDPSKRENSFRLCVDRSGTGEPRDLRRAGCGSSPSSSPCFVIRLRHEQEDAGTGDLRGPGRRMGGGG